MFPTCSFWYRTCVVAITLVGSLGMRWGAALRLMPWSAEPHFIVVDGSLYTYIYLGGPQVCCHDCVHGLVVSPLRVYGLHKLYSLFLGLACARYCDIRPLGIPWLFAWIVELFVGMSSL